MPYFLSLRLTRLPLVLVVVLGSVVLVVAVGGGDVVDLLGRGVIGEEGESPLDEGTVAVVEEPHKVMDSRMGK